MAMRNMPVWMSHGHLVATLQDILDHVAAGDSFEGSIEYLLPGPGDQEHFPEFRDAPEDEWMRGFLVQASYRIGNTQGQGSLRMIGQFREVPEEPGV
jgi:hypothetical protein